MKRRIIIFLIVFCFAISAEARTDKCFWIWSTDVTGANDPPDSVYCSLDGKDYVSVGTTYIQNSQGADMVQMVYDTTWNNSNTVPDIPDTITPCSNTASTGDLNVLICDNTICSTGTTTVAYFQVDNIADNIKNGFKLSPPVAFDLSVDGDTATCWVVRTVTHWD